MNRKMHDLISLCLGGFLLLILFSPLPCIAQDGFPGLRILISPLPGTIAGLPMEISFNGSARQTGASENHHQNAGITGPDLSEEKSPAGQDRAFARIQDYMLKYVNLATPASGREMFDNAASGIEGKPSEKISFEVQAGLADLSGALFIVLQL